MNWYIQVLKKYADFTGRARRKEYWFFALFNFIIYICLDIILLALAVISNSQSVVADIAGSIAAIVYIVLIIYALSVIIPGLAVTVRRLHDTDRRGWWIFIAFIPFVGPIILLIFEVLDSTVGENRFGPNPKGIEAEQVAAT